MKNYKSTKSIIKLLFSARNGFIRLEHTKKKKHFEVLLIEESIYIFDMYG